MSSTFSPSVLDLSASEVQLIQTSRTNPKVTLDATGLKSFDALGNIIAELLANGTALEAQISALGLSMPGDQTPLQGTIEWLRSQTDQSVMSEILGTLNGVAHDLLITSKAPPGDTGQIQLQIEANPAPAAASAILFTTDHAGVQKQLQLFNSLGNSDLLQKADNLSDLGSATTARNNLGLSRPSMAGRNSALAIAGTGPQIIPLDSKFSDPDGNLPAGAPFTFTCPRAGYYLCLGEVTIITSASSFFSAQIFHNGVHAILGTTLNTSGVGLSWGSSVAGMVGPCAAGDTIQLGFSLGAVNSTSLQIINALQNYLHVAQWSLS